MRQSRLFFVGLVILALATAAMAADGPRAMPRFDGQSFAGRVGAGVDTQAILNVTPETVALYLYFPRENMLRQMWSVKAESVKTEDGWHVTLPEKGLAFHLGLAESGEISLDGKTLSLREMEPRDIEQLPVEVQRSDCRAGGLAPAEHREHRDPRLGDAKSDALCSCCLALVFNGCCASCYCVHRSLDLPYWVDSICCGASC
jgi:hypothetical protein